MVRFLFEHTFGKSFWTFCLPCPLSFGSLLPNPTLNFNKVKLANLFGPLPLSLSHYISDVRTIPIMSLTLSRISYMTVCECIKITSKVKISWNHIS